MIAQYLWIFHDSGLCLVQDRFLNKTEKTIDEHLLGGITTALFDMATTFSSIRAIILGNTVLYYFTSNNIITCLGVDKTKNNEKAKPVVEKIHEKFLAKYTTYIHEKPIFDAETFVDFKEHYISILHEAKLLPPEVFPTPVKVNASFRDRLRATMDKGTTNEKKS